MTESIILGLGYQSGVGKSTLAHHLVKHHGFARMSIARKLKDVASNILEEDIDAEFKDKLLVRSTGREFLQKLAEFVRNELGADYFISNMSIYDTLHVCSKVVIDDVRFAEEVDYIHSIGGLALKVVRPGIHRDHSDREIEWSGAIAKWDDTVTNIDIDFACEQILRVISGERFAPPDLVSHDDDIVVGPLRKSVRT